MSNSLFASVLAWFEAQPPDVQAHIALLARRYEPGWVAESGCDWDAEGDVEGIHHALRARVAAPASLHEGVVLWHVIDSAMTLRETPEAWVVARKRDRAVAALARRQGLLGAARVAERSADPIDICEAHWLAAAATWWTLRREL